MVQILVLSEDDERAEIIAAGLELSGYDVKTAPVQKLVPLIVCVFPLPRLPKNLNYGKLLVIGQSHPQADITLPYPYPFQDLLAAVSTLLTPSNRPTIQFSSKEDEERKYHDLFNRASDAIFLVDLETHIIIDVNQQAVKLYGFDRDELIGMSLLQIVPEDQHKSMLENTRNIDREHKVIHVAKRAHRKKDGSIFYVSVSAALIQYGGRWVFQDIVRDETERLRYEAELLAANEELQQLSQLKDEFVSNISHELRTPITSLRIRQYLMEKKPDELAFHLETLQREIDRLETLIDDLLILSRLDQKRQQFHFRDVDLNKLVEEYAIDRTPLAEEKGLVLSYFLDTSVSSVRADANLLGQVLSILLTNAMNYTVSGGHIRLKVCQSSFDGRQWTGFCVEDTGSGISKEEQASLFTRFFRGTAAQELSAPGTGLGLAIAKEIVDYHNGNIRVESELGQGTAFYVWL